MGILASRNRSVAEDVDQSNINPLSYRYPPKEGNYFANYFIMGGERFEVQQPEAYLFGDNQDLNFLGTRPVPVSFTTYFYHSLSHIKFCTNIMCIIPVSIFSTTNK